MTAADIAQHNRKYLMEVEMEPDSKRIAEYVETAPQPIKDVWNAAIEAAYNKADRYSYEAAQEIRKLKK